MSLSELLALLNDQYLNAYETTIVGGHEEPFYRAFDGQNGAQIQFSHDYIRSALHELAHWCVAGEQRRKMDDYGYWYAADGRDQEQQNAFYQVEVKPQTIEWAFSLVIDVDFEPSVDNLDNQVQGAADFAQALNQQMLAYLQQGFSPRVEQILRLMGKHQEIDDVMQYIRQKLGKKTFWLVERYEMQYNRAAFAETCGFCIW